MDNISYHGNFALNHYRELNMTTQTQTNTNTLNNTILSIVGQATKLDGTRQEGLALTKFHDAIENGSVIFDITGNGFSVNGTEQNLNVAIASFYVQAFDNKTVTLEDLITFSAAGVISAKQLSCLESESKPTTKKPLPGHNITSSEYLKNAFTLAATPGVIEQIYNLLHGLKATDNKADILATTATALALILTPEQEAGLANMIAEEEAFAKRFEALSVYFTDIKSSGTLSTGTVKVSDIQEAVALLTANGLELVGVPPLNIETLTFKVTFKPVDVANNI